MGAPKILIVEDDPLIRMMAAEALTDAGLAVVEAATAAAALAILEIMADEVSVVFSDVEMPGAMNGVDLSEHVHARWPGLPVVLTSGRVAPDGAVFSRDAPFMPKPYDCGEIIDLLVRLASRRA